MSADNQSNQDTNAMRDLEWAYLGPARHLGELGRYEGATIRKTPPVRILVTAATIQALVRGTVQRFERKRPAA